MRKPIITNLEQYGDHGWQWDMLDWNGELYTGYRTNGDGEGLWIYEQDGGTDYDLHGKESASYAWKQTHGTGQYSLRGRTKGAVR